MNPAAAASLRAHALALWVARAAALMLLTACSDVTHVSGVVEDTASAPIEGALVNMGFTEEFDVETTTGADGRFNLRLKERCYPICAGGHPDITVSKPGFETWFGHALRFEKNDITVVLVKTP